MIHGTALRAGLALLVVAACVSFGVRAEDRPVTIPTRDVDVVYRMGSPQSDSKDEPSPLRQRMRWAVSEGKLRVDPPSPGLYVVMDYRTHTLTTVRDAQRLVFDMPAPTAAMGAVGATSAATSFVRGGPDRIAGLDCVEWTTSDTAGEPTRVCLTVDGVLLRAIGGERVLVEAQSVQYGPIDPTVFQIPKDYTRVVPPLPPPVAASPHASTSTVVPVR